MGGVLHDGRGYVLCVGAALKAAGGHPKFTEYPNGKHMDSAIKAFEDPELFARLFEQKR
jgi:hypothetical protein